MSGAGQFGIDGFGSFAFGAAPAPPPGAFAGIIGVSPIGEFAIGVGELPPPQPPAPIPGPFPAPFVKPTYTGIQQVLAQLEALPPQFLRPGATFAWIYQALAGGESWYTQASWGVNPQVAGLPSAEGPWLTTWGEILGIGRLAGESDGAYSARVQETLLAPVGTPLAIQSYSRFILNSPTITVTENLPAVVGYTISIPPGYPTIILNNWITGLARIRPAGVPFNVVEFVGPLILGSWYYLGASGMASPYLGKGILPVSVAIGATTNNAQSLLPELLLTDPTLNGGLALGLG